MIHPSAQQVSVALQQLASAERAKNSARFFKTGPGEYGYGDMFIGVSVPQQRIVAKSFRELEPSETEILLRSPIHEERLTALFIQVAQFKSATKSVQKAIYEQYLENTQYINNWDLVDSSAPYIVGGYLFDKDRAVLQKLARSKNLWERRIAMLATFYFIREKQTDDAFAVAELLLGDKHDLIHKAVGWMLREVGKNCGQEVEESFLKQHYETMPRTMLRYAIEHFDPDLRAKYLHGLIQS